MEETKMLKLKKILSVVSAFAIALTTFAGMTIAEAADEPTIYTVLEQKTFSDSADYDGYTQYVLTIKAKNLNDLAEFTTSGIGANKKYTGAGAKMINLNLDFDASKVGMCDIKELVTGGSVTKNVETGQFLWTTTTITEYIQKTEFDIAEIHFVALADADWNPATEDYTSNPISLSTKAQSLAYGVFAAQKPAEGSTVTLANGTDTLAIVDGEYGKTEPSYPFDKAVALKFNANEKTYVNIVKGEESNNYFLPANVKGDSVVYGLLKYTADGKDVKVGDVFTITFVNSDTEAVTETVAE